MEIWADKAAGMHGTTAARSSQRAERRMFMDEGLLFFIVARCHTGGRPAARNRLDVDQFAMLGRVAVSRWIFPAGNEPPR
jgi:hypothetical protein